MRSLSSFECSGIVFPVAPSGDGSQEHDIHTCFMRHVRCVPNSRMAIKMLSAIQFTADTLSCSDAHVAKVLVDLGLRAPRLAFPSEFLDFADRTFSRYGGAVYGPSQALLALKMFWEMSDAAEGECCPEDHFVFRTSPASFSVVIAG